MNWTMFWTLTSILINIFLAYYWGWTHGKRESYKKCRSNIFNDLIRFENEIKKLNNLAHFEIAHILLLEVFNYLRDQENERRN